MTNNLELLLRLFELVAVVVGVVKVVTDVGAIKNTFINFPLHRHVNGKIIYPVGYEPPEAQNVMAATHGR